MTERQLLLEAIQLLARARDHLILKPDDRIKAGEITLFVTRCKEALK